MNDHPIGIAVFTWKIIHLCAGKGNGKNLQLYFFTISQ